MADGINYSEALIESLERSLRSAFNQRFLRLTRRPGKPGAAFYVFLDKGDKNAQTNEGGQQTVATVLTANRQPTPFYFGFVATFSMLAHHHALQHASLFVFQDLYAGELIPLFRAEWDQIAASDNISKHAQPHWHFVQGPERIENIVRALAGSPREFHPEENGQLFNGAIDSGGFHFAMTSFLPFKKEQFHSESFRQWFENLTRYVGEQIEYLVSKAPPAAIPTTDFSPD